MPTPWHYHHHASLMRWYALDHEQFLYFSMLFSFHHSGTSWSLSHLSIGCCSRTVKAYLDVVWQTLIWPSCFRDSPMVYILWWTLCIHMVKSSLDCWLWHTHTPTSWRVFLIWPTVVKGVFFTRERILRSSTTVVFHGLPGSLVFGKQPKRFLRERSGMLCNGQVNHLT